MSVNTRQNFKEVSFGDSTQNKPVDLFSLFNPPAEKKPVIHIGFTGHRPSRLGGYNINTPKYETLQKDLEHCIERALEEYDTVVGHSGLALGGDTIWSKAVLSMKTRYPERVQFHAEIPMLEQHEQWFKESDVEFWHKQAESADFTSVYGSLADRTVQERKHLSAKLLNDRNKGMVDHSDLLLALWDGSSGGTANAVSYGRRTETTIVVVNPKYYFST